MKELEAPDFPMALSHVWSAFLSLNDCRTVGSSSINPLSYQEIKAFMELTLTPMSPRDVEAVVKLDKIYMEIMLKDG